MGASLRPLRSSENKMFTFWMLVAIARSSVAIDAICTFAGDGNGEVTGEVHLFNAHEDSETEIHGAVFGLNPGLHGFHIHAEGDLGDNCKNALGHFNPAGVNHGATGDEVDPQIHAQRIHRMIKLGLGIEDDDGDVEDAAADDMDMPPAETTSAPSRTT